MAFTSSIRLARAYRAPAFTMRAAQQAQRMRFSGAVVRLAGKESELHTEGRAEEIDAHKQEQLSKAKTGANEFKPELASDSEEAVKADKSGGRGKQDMKKLQEETKHAAEKKHG